jgi:shikimate dehydrogenase
MRKFGLIGYPLGHSFSKKYFAEKFINEHINDCHYDNYPLTDLGQLNKLIHDDSELEGLNITIPYKSQIINLLDEVDTEAVEIGAVNVLKIKRINGKIKLLGFNSDVTGIRESLAPYIDKKIKNAIVLGTGGSSKAVCHVLKKFAVGINQISRVRKQGMLTYDDVDSDLINSVGLIVNTTPLGMYPNIETRPNIDYTHLNSKHILFDLVYNPELTSFLSMGKERGCIIISGIKMLHSQAERSWEIWNDESL